MKFTKEEMSNALDEAYKKAGDNAYFANGFALGVEFAQQQVKKCDLADVGGSYLVKFVDPKKEYPVEYTIKQDGTKVYKSQMLIGADLTEPQIVDLFNKRLL